MKGEIRIYYWSPENRKESFSFNNYSELDKPLIRIQNNGDVIFQSDGITYTKAINNYRVVTNR